MRRNPNECDAKRRESYFKTSEGRSSLKVMLAEFLRAAEGPPLQLLLARPSLGLGVSQLPVTSSLHRGPTFTTSTVDLRPSS